MEKYCRAGLATNENMVHARCMLDNYGKSARTHAQTHTHRTCNSYIFSTITTITRMLLNVKLLIYTYIASVFELI